MQEPVDTSHPSLSPIAQCNCAWSLAEESQKSLNRKSGSLWDSSSLPFHLDFVLKAVLHHRKMSKRKYLERIIHSSTKLKLERTEVEAGKILRKLMQLGGFQQSDCKINKVTNWGSVRRNHILSSYNNCLYIRTKYI